MENKGQNGNPDLTAIRMMLAELATGQARNEHLMQQHEELMADIAKTLAATARILRSHAKVMERIEASQERAEANLNRIEATVVRSERKLELHGDLIAELIQNKADRKKRPPRK